MSTNTCSHSTCETIVESDEPSGPPSLLLEDIEQQMPLLVAIAQEISGDKDEVTALLPTARQLLRESFRALDGRYTTERLKVA